MMPTRDVERGSPGQRQGQAGQAGQAFWACGCGGTIPRLFMLILIATDAYIAISAMITAACYPRGETQRGACVSFPSGRRLTRTARPFHQQALDETLR